MWKLSGMAQSFRFDLLDRATGELISFDDMLGLVPHIACPPESDIYRLGEFAREQRIWIYVAISHRPLQPADMPGWIGKLTALNRYYGERVTTPDKKVLILPDYFGLHEQFNHGQVLADFGLTSLEG